MSERSSAVEDEVGEEQQRRRGRRRTGGGGGKATEMKATRKRALKTGHGKDDGDHEDDRQENKDPGEQVAGQSENTYRPDLILRNQVYSVDVTGLRSYTKKPRLAEIMY